MMKVLAYLVLVGLLALSCHAQTKQPNVSICQHSYKDIPVEVQAEMVAYSGKSINDMGNYDECLYLKKEYSHYCVAQISISAGTASSNVEVYTGLCVSSMCDADMVKAIMVTDVNKTTPYIPSKYSLPNGWEQDLQVNCIPRGYHPLTWSAVVAIVFFSFIALLVIAGTTLEWLEGQAADAAKKQYMNAARDPIERAPLMADEGPTSINSETPTGEFSTVRQQGSIHRLSVDAQGHPLTDLPKKKPGKFVEFLKCFAIGANIGFLIKDNRAGEPNLAHMNGIRCLMMAWIILSHSFVYTNSPVGFDNLTIVAKQLLVRLSFQVIPAAEQAVDAFFYLSAFLVAYMVLKEMKNSKRGTIPWGLFYFHRYWRLTPVYACVIWFYTVLTPFFIYGPFSYLYYGQKIEFCVKTWWANLLYINNFVPSDSDSQCLGWGWYLANDMQFFVLSPLIILLFKKSRPATFAVLAFLFAASLILCGVLVGVNDLEPLSNSHKYNSTIYGKPYIRVPPYLLGLGVAFLVQYDFDLLRRWYVRWPAYAVACTLTTGISYATKGYYENNWNESQNVAYAVTTRCLFVIGLAVFNYACFKGHGGVLRSLMSLYIWVPISRLTYLAYLTHPIIMFVVSFNQTTNFHYSAIEMGIRYSAYMLLAYLCALVFHLAIEKPTANLERIMLPARGGKKH